VTRSVEVPLAPEAAGGDLVERISRGDESAFEALFREHYTVLVRFAEGLVRSREGAEDAVQDVLLNVWRNRETFRVEDSVRAYLFRAVRNRALNQLRNERVRRDAGPRLAGESGSAPRGDVELAERDIDRAVREAVNALPPRCREVFELSRGQGLRYAEIATVLGISVKTVETQMGRALKSLRERLAPHLP
jgi:RNA polymerase sigma-70 factor (ECF subfamily)